MGLQETFNQALEELGPFEDKPHLAIATSGGSDSLCLVFLAWHWVHQREGTLTSLIVDHGLRPDSEAEAAQTRDLLSVHQIPAVILKWTGEKPARRIQERAREARYGLLLKWCHNHQTLHLLLGHHQDDQRETFQLRQAKKSGALGLSGMSALSETPSVRILRPLLQFSKSCLREYLTSRNIPFVEDPSNVNLKYSRTALRKENLTFSEQAQLIAMSYDYGICRIQEEKETNQIVSQCVEIFPQGYGLLKKEHYQQLSEKQQLNVLQRCLMTFGVGHYPPRRDSLKKIRKNPEITRTLHGCLIFNYQHWITFVREPEKIEKMSLTGNARNYRWDDRFNFSFLPEMYENFSELSLAPLEEEGWKHINKTPEGEILKTLPHPVRLGLPALWEGSRFLQLLVPISSKFTKKKECAIHFAPRYPLTRFTFTIV